MTPPEQEAIGSDVMATAPAVSVCLVTLTKRADFLRAAQGRRQALPGFLLQARRRGDDNPDIRVGYTCSKKVGNAVTRNRAKRRLREVARALLPTSGQSGWDYVLVGRPGATVERVFADLLADMASGLVQVHRARTK